MTLMTIFFRGETFMTLMTIMQARADTLIRGHRSASAHLSHDDIETPVNVGLVPPEVLQILRQEAGFRV